MNSKINDYIHKYRRVAITAVVLMFVPMISLATVLDGSFETDSAVADSAGVFTIVEEMPEIIGGLSELYKAIQYPESALRNNVEGRVFLQFVVNEDGQASEIEILRDIGNGCGEAAVEAIKKVSFTPGRQNGQTVKVQFSLPVTFRINT